jgi:hypothetical protein
LFIHDTDTCHYTGLKLGREKRVTPEFGERKEEKILPSNSGCYATASPAALTMAIASVTRVATQAASFHIDQGDHGEDNHLGMPQDDNAPMPASRVDIPRELAVVPVPAGGQDTQLEQFREMQAKLDEEAGRLVQLRQNIEQEWAGRALAGGAPHWARDVQRRIVDDVRARLPPAFSGVGQNLAAAAMLL